MITITKSQLELLVEHSLIENTEEMFAYIHMVQNYIELAIAPIVTDEKNVILF